MNCDKCGQPVEDGNDAVRVAARAEDNPMLLLIAAPRHFLPVDGCDGSPSRAQYIDGQPRDARGYPYQVEWESRYRSAHAEIVAEYSDKL